MHTLFILAALAAWSLAGLLLIYLRAQFEAAFNCAYVPSWLVVLLAGPAVWAVAVYTGWYLRHDRR